MEKLSENGESNNSGVYCNFKCNYKSKIDQKELEITFDELNELRDRALISNPNDYLSKDNYKNNNKSSGTKTDLQLNEIFLQFVDYVKSIKKYLEGLNVLQLWIKIIYAS